MHRRPLLAVGNRRCGGEIRAIIRNRNDIALRHRKAAVRVIQIDRRDGVTAIQLQRDIDGGGNGAQPVAVGSKQNTAAVLNAVNQSGSIPSGAAVVDELACGNGNRCVQRHVGRLRAGLGILDIGYTPSLQLTDNGGPAVSGGRQIHATILRDLHTNVLCHNGLSQCKDGIVDGLGCRRRSNGLPLNAVLGYV